MQTYVLRPGIYKLDKRRTAKIDHNLPLADDGNFAITKVKGDRKLPFLILFWKFNFLINFNPFIVVYHLLKITIKHLFIE